MMDYGEPVQGAVAFLSFTKGFFLGLLWGAVLASGVWFVCVYG